MHTYKALLETNWTTDRNRLLVVVSHGKDLNDLLDNAELHELLEDGKTRFIEEIPFSDKKTQLLCTNLLVDWFELEYDRVHADEEER